jgi:DNA-binding transcriptional regulator YdaS (Cro superfamily)
MDLKTYLSTLTLDERATFAAACGSTAGHLRNIGYGDRLCRESLAIEIEKATNGLVTCEELRPDVDWAYVRGSAAMQEGRKSA